MKKAWVAASAVCLAGAAFGSVAVDTFSENFGYEILAGSNVTGAASSAGYTDTANQFTAAAGGAITDIWLPVAIVGASPNIFDVTLRSDANNSPGDLLATWQVVGQAFPFNPQYHDPIHLTITDNVSLQQGTTYWLDLHSTDAAGALVWDFTHPPIFQNVAQRFSPNGAWNVLIPGFTSAYRIDVVPEPATALALGLLAGVLLRARR